MRARVVLAAAAALLAAACTVNGSSGDDIGDGTKHPWSDDIVLASALQPFDQCDQLLSYVKEHALDMVGPWGLNGGVYPAMAREGMASSDAAAGEADALAATESAPAPVEGEDYSGTNVQEAGVDEPDNVKTDGEYLYLIRDEYLEIVDVRGDEPVAASSTRLGGWGGQLLLSDDRLLVLGQTEGGAHPLSGDSDVMWTGGTALSLYDVASPTDPALISTLQLDGSVASARLVDGVARVVLSAQPVGLPFVTPEGSGLRAEREATEKNRAIIEDSTIDNWVPYYVHTTADGQETEDSLLSCDRVSHPADFSGLGTTTVLSLDLTQDLAPQDSGAAVLAGTDTVYAASDRLYVATNRWVDWDRLRDDAAEDASARYTTEIHAFDITDPRSASYVGSGSVRGHVLSQWAMSRHNGVLRVATTEGARWWAQDGSRPVSQSFVTTFAEQDGELVELGSVGGLGKDERIYAVRYIGDVGFVVTFRETDPLYTIDLSNPEQPKVMGELKILGYSAYLHPIDDQLLLGVGQNADDQGRTTGMQLSLFDISDLSNPQRIHQTTLADAQSEAEWDHHAFLYWPQTGLTVVPYQAWSFDEIKKQESVDNGALAYTLSREGGFDEVGRVTHLPKEAADSSNPRFYDMSWQAAIQRSIVIGDRLVTVSQLGVKVSDLTTLEDRGWLELPNRVS